MLKFFVVSFFVVYLSLQAMEQELTKETAWLVHATQVFPKDGHMIAGTLLMVPPSQKNNWNNTLVDLYKQATYSSTSWKCSLHWSVNSLVYPDLYNGKKYDASRYVVIEPLKAFNQKTLHGHWQDVYHVGSHELSADSVILVPLEDISWIPYKGCFKGALETYDADKQSAVEKYVQRKGAAILSPSMHGVPDRGGLRYLHSPLIQQVLCSRGEKPSDEVSRLLELSHTLFQDSALGKIKKTLTPLLHGLLAAQFLTSLRWPELACLEQCCMCHTNLRTQHTSCATCCLAYCSLKCAVADQDIHNERCGTIATTLKAYRSAHKKYLDLYRQQPFGGYHSLVKRLSDSIHEEFLTDRERSITAAYKEYTLLLVMLLYSPKQPFTRIRNFFDVCKPQGFMTFAKEIRYILSHYEEALQSIS